MTVRHLNLFDAGLRPERRWLTPSRVFYGVLGLLLVMALGGVAIDRETKSLREQTARVQGELAQLAQRLAPPAAAGGEPAAAAVTPGSAGSDERIALRERLERLAQLQQLRATLHADAPPGLPAQVFEGLALAAPGDAWIVRARWSGAGPERQLSLEGELLDPRRMPAYLRRLEAQAVFRGLRFAEMRVEPVPTERGQHHAFVLAGQRKEDAR